MSEVAVPKISTPLAIALQYLARGLAPIPVHPRGKEAVLTGWQKIESPTEAQVREMFEQAEKIKRGKGPLNVGVVFGRASGGRVDIDLDCPEALALAPHFLPTTGAVYGRKSKRRSHWLYVCADLPEKIFTFQDPTRPADGAMLVEIRGSEHQSVVPGSVHEEGEKVEWDSDGEPAAISVEDLLRAVRKLAVATLLMRYWNSTGGRDVLCVTITGCLLRYTQWSVEEVDEFVATVARAAGDTETEKHRHKAERIATWKNKAGWKRLGEVLNKDIARKFAAWLTPNAGADAYDREALLEELNGKHGLYIDGPKIRAVHYVRDPLHYVNVPRLIDLAALHQLYRNRERIIVMNPVTDKPVAKIVTEWWLDQPERREVYAFILEPDDPGDDPSVINLWQGWRHPPTPDGNCELFYKFMFEVIANGNETNYKYVLDWLADAVQYPTDKRRKRPGVCLVLRGDEGVGKGFFVRALEALYGLHFARVDQDKQFIGNFNSILMGRLLLFVDEGFWAGDKKAQGVLHGLITEPDVNIEKKFHDAVPMRSSLRIIIAGNHDWQVPANANARRYCVLDINGEHRDDHAYFKAIGEQLRAGGFGKLLHDLQTRDISKVEIRDFPRTDALLDQKIASMEPEVQFLFELAQNGVLPGDFFAAGESHRWWLYKCSQEFARGVSKKHRLSEQRFANLMKETIKLPFVGIGSRKIPRGDRVWTFDTLAATRARWDEYLGQKVPWSAPDEWQEDTDHEEFSDADVGRVSKQSKLKKKLDPASL